MNCVIVLGYKGPEQKFWAGGRWSPDYCSALVFDAAEARRQLRRACDFAIPRGEDGCTVCVVADYGFDTERKV